MGARTRVRARALHSEAAQCLRVPVPPRKDTSASAAATERGWGLGVSGNAGAERPEAADKRGLITRATPSRAEKEPGVTAATMSSGDSGAETRLSPWGPAGRALLQPQRLLVSRKRFDAVTPPGCSGTGPWGAVVETPSVLAVAGIRRPPESEGTETAAPPQALRWAPVCHRVDSRRKSLRPGRPASEPLYALVVEATHFQGPDTSEPSRSEGGPGVPRRAAPGTCQQSGLRNKACTLMGPRVSAPCRQDRREKRDPEERPQTPSPGGCSPGTGVQPPAPDPVGLGGRGLASLTGSGTAPGGRGSGWPAPQRGPGDAWPRGRLAPGTPGSLLRPQVESARGGRPSA